MKHKKLLWLSLLLIATSSHAVPNTKLLDMSKKLDKVEAAKAKEKREKEEAERQRQAAAVRTGDYELYSYPHQPEVSDYATKWSITCKEGGYAYVSYENKRNASQIYTWGSGGFTGASGGAESGYNMSLDDIMRKACIGK